VATGTHSAASGGSWVWVDAFQVSGSVTADSPTIVAAGVAGAASFTGAQDRWVAPGQIVSISGQNFLAAGGLTASVSPLPTQLGPQSTAVNACGYAFPLFSVFPQQIYAQIPLECPAGGVLIATVTVGGQTTAQAFALAPASPGIFTVDGSGAGDGAIVHADHSLVSAANPASAGEEVVIYATGLGATNPPFATGFPADRPNTTTLPLSVTIGGKVATVSYGGLTECCVGLYQVNAITPSGLTGTQPVVITVGAIYSSQAGVTMSLR